MNNKSKFNCCFNCCYVAHHCEKINTVELHYIKKQNHKVWNYWLIKRLKFSKLQKEFFSFLFTLFWFCMHGNNLKTQPTVLINTYYALANRLCSIIKMLVIILYDNAVLLIRYFGEYMKKINFSHSKWILVSLKLRNIFFSARLTLLNIQESTTATK